MTNVSQKTNAFVRLVWNALTVCKETILFCAPTSRCNCKTASLSFQCCSVSPGAIGGNGFRHSSWTSQSNCWTGFCKSRSVSISARWRSPLVWSGSSAKSLRFHWRIFWNGFMGFFLLPNVTDETRAGERGVSPFEQRKMLSGRSPAGRRWSALSLPNGLAWSASDG